MVFVNWPWEQEKVLMFLEALNIKYLRIPPGADQYEIQKVVNTWNSKMSNVEVIVLSSKTAALGLNSPNFKA